MKLIKLLLLSLLSLALMAILALVLAFTLIDPARYKSTIESVFARQSGLQLQIAGDIDWAFNPVFGLSLSDLRLRNPNSPMELASLANITIRIEPRALLDGRLQMQEFIADDLHINWIVNAEGVSNWPAAQAEQSDSDSNRTAPTTDTAISAEIAQITVSNASLSIQDALRGINTSFERLHFSSQNSNLENRAFPFELSFVVTDNIADQNATVSISSQATVDLARGNARLDELQVKLNPLQLQGQLVLNDFRNALSWSSELRSNTFALSDFLDLYVRTAQDEPTPLGDYSDSEDQFSLSLSATGNAQAITLNSLHLALDAMRLDANASYTAALPGGRANLRYELSANALDLNRYTQPGGAQPTAPAENNPPINTEDATSTTTPSDTELPIELLQSMNIQGVHRIDSLAIGGLQLGAINANLNVQDGLLNFDLRPVSFYEGQISTTVNYDTRPNPASLTSISSVRNVNVAGLASALPMTRFATGRLNVESLHTLYGRTVNQLLDSVSGTTSFSLDDNSIDISIVKQLFSSISVLSPAGTGDATQQWPDRVGFSSLAGHLILDQGLDANQQFKVALDNVEIAANGGVERNDSRFHYDATLTVFGEPAPQTIAVAPLYQGVGWPVICEGSFSAAPSEFCGPDFSRVRDLFEQIARDEVQRRAQEAIQERVPEELQDAARSLLDRFRR